jgi:YVTN family beta-propeller protein
VANGIDGVISIIDTATDNITANVTVGEVPVGVAVSPDEKKSM